jgi:heat shock protein HslJ
LISLGCAAVLGGCAAQATQPSLAGSSWQLIEIQAKDEAQGTSRPADPSLYTVTFGADGRAAFRLDCNRGNAQWQAAPAAGNAGMGQLTFGLLAAPRAVCPPGSLDERLSRQLALVRGYRLEAGSLHMSLLGDGGILVWAPVR